MNPAQAEKDLTEISKDRDLIESYNTYWASIAPKTDEGIFRRYVFSFLSVHTSWSTNVRSFLLLEQNKDAYNNQKDLAQLIKAGGAQYFNTKAKGIFQFKKDFERKPRFFTNEDQYRRGLGMREDIRASCHGLGLAKSSFVVEMLRPLDNNSVCLDTHLLQLYGYADSKERTRAGSNPKKYREMEAHWVKTCNTLNISPTIARAIWWDKKQNQKDSRYWTYVLEDGL